MAKNVKLEGLLRDLRDGKIDFGTYVVGTRTEYRAMAAYLLRRWTAPEWLTQEDVEQELYVSTWKHVWGYVGEDGGFVDFDSTRGVSLSRWVVFGAMVAAKRALHKARGVTISGSPDRKPSQFETPASFLGDDGDSFLESILAEAPAAEREIGKVQETRKKATAALRACASTNERYAVLAIREAGSIDGASRVLFEDQEHRAALKLRTPNAAEKFVREHAYAVALRIDGDATAG